MKLFKNTYIYLQRFMKREINYFRVKPTNLLLFLTYRCTSRCNSCTMWQRENKQGELSLSEWKNFIDMVSNKGIVNVEMFGGDALLRKDVLLPLIEYAKSKGILEADLSTNCNLMDHETAIALVNVGLNTVYVSVDGVGVHHDQLRGTEGSFERVKRGLQYLIQAKKGGKHPRIVANCTISSLNVDFFEEILPFAEEIGVDVLAFEYVGQFPLDSIHNSKIDGLEPAPYYIPQGPSILLNREQAVLLKQKLKMIKGKTCNTRLRVVTNNIDVLTIDNLISGKFPNKRCYICRYLITVDPFGNLIPCPFFNNYYLGNIQDKHFDEIWNNGRHHNFLRYYKRRIDMCNYCILGIERNPAFFQSIRKAYFTFTRKGFDE